MPERSLRRHLAVAVALLLAVTTSLAIASRGAYAATTTQAVIATEGAASRLKDAAESCLVNSFTADTPVLMANGNEEAIADVKVGDEVLATDPETGVTAARPVAALIHHSGIHTMVDLTLSDGSKITSTDRHPFWDATTRAFTDAIDLHVGDRVLSDNGRTLTIATKHIYDRNLTAYNLQIDGIHTYYAGATPVLVHNSCSETKRELLIRYVLTCPGGSEYEPGKGIWEPGTDAQTLRALADATKGQIGQFQPGYGTVKYVINARRIVGTENGRFTSLYTVTRDPYDAAIRTMFPGVG